MILDTLLGVNEAFDYGSELDGVESIPLKEGEDPLDAMYRITMENEQNFNNIVNTIALSEVNYMIENGTTDVVYEAVDIYKIVDTVTTAIENTWAKLKAVYESVMDKIDDLIHQDNKFVKKYKEDESTYSKVKVTVKKIHTFANGNFFTGNGSKGPEIAQSACDSAFDPFNKKITKMLIYVEDASVNGRYMGKLEKEGNNIRTTGKEVKDFKTEWAKVKATMLDNACNEIVEGSTRATFSTKAVEYFTNDSAQTITGSEAYDMVSNGNLTKTTLRKQRDSAKKAYSNIIKETKALKRFNKKNKNASTVLGIKIEYARMSSSLISEVSRVLIRIAVKNFNAYRAVLRSIVKGKESDTETNESVTYYRSSDGESLICNII